MRNLAIILLAAIFCSCNSYDYKITSLEQKRLKFDELPLEVKRYLSNRPKCEEYDMLLFVDLADTANYREETVGTLIGPWVDYEKLIDKQKSISYRINQGVPSPYIVFKSKLYIPDRYDILCGGSVFEAMYTEYQLK